MLKKIAMIFVLIVNLNAIDLVECTAYFYIIKAFYLQTGDYTKEQMMRNYGDKTIKELSSLYGDTKTIDMVLSEQKRITNLFQQRDKTTLKKIGHRCLDYVGHP